VELINRKRAGRPIKAPAPTRTSGNVVDLMDALRKSIAGGRGKDRKRAAGQKEMLLPINGRGEAPAERKQCGSL
jgi:DNA end-binding protein Ku